MLVTPCWFSLLIEYLMNLWLNRFVESHLPTLVLFRKIMNDFMRSIARCPPSRTNHIR